MRLAYERILSWLQRMKADERGLSTAELLGNAALAIAAPVVIWAALETLGLEVVDWIRTQIMGSCTPPNWHRMNADSQRPSSCWWWLCRCSSWRGCST